MARKMERRRQRQRADRTGQSTGRGRVWVCAAATAGKGRGQGFGDLGSFTGLGLSRGILEGTMAQMGSQGLGAQLFPGRAERIVR